MPIGFTGIPRNRSNVINVTSGPRKTIEETDDKATYTMKFDRLRYSLI